MLKLCAANVCNLAVGIMSLVEMSDEDLRFRTGGASLTNKSLM